MLQGLRRILPLRSGTGDELPFEVLFKKFKSILERNNQILELMADMGDKLGGEYVFDRQYLLAATQRLSDLVFKMISDLSVLSERKNRELFLAFGRIQHQIQEELAGRHEFPGGGNVLPLFGDGGDSVDLCGGKMAVLTEMHDRLHLSVPDGFVITTRAFFEFMEHNGLPEEIRSGLAAWDGRDQDALRALSERVTGRILAGGLPRRLASDIEARLDALIGRRSGAPPQLALRSSAWGENGDVSFAGQYLSVLGASRREVADAYRRVVAGTYGYEAWRYRLERDFREHETAMAVGCQVMVPGAVSGVLHTWSLNQGQPAMLVSAAWGLGAPLVGGDVGGDTFFLARTPPYQVWSMNVTDKAAMLVLDPKGGTTWLDVPDERRKVPCLSPRRLQALAEAAMTIERWYKRPQEIEWTIDESGELWLLQSRPLMLRPPRGGEALPVDDAVGRAEVVLSGRGATAQRGVAVGRVVVVSSDEDLEHFPHGAILVSRFTSPRYSRIMCKARGIITDVGSPAGHMATIAREYRVPTVVGAEGATELLSTGDEITLDATQNVVYRGRISELDHFELTEEMVFEESYEYRLLRRLLARISPLGLVDPHSPDFTPQGCRTYHDITRYIHEKAVEVLIGLTERQGRRAGASAPRRLVTEQPLGLTVLDAGGGLDVPEDASVVAPEQVLSRPLRELLTGIRESGMWCTDPVSVDMGSFMSSVTRTFCASLAGPKDVGRNLAVVFKEYMNLHLRLGYHFTIIDAYLSETVNDNMIYFRFLGGVTDFTRRTRRARFIGEVLARFDFRVEVHGDLVVGRLKKLSLPRMIRRMRMLGGLIGYTRQLDALMHDDEQISHHVEAFSQAIHEVLGGQGER